MQEKETIIGGLKINYKVAGEGQHILVLHGWGGSSDSWLGVAEILAKNNFKVVVPDLPGFGKSEPPKSIWGVGDYADFALAFMMELKLEKVYLIGHSFGGRVSIKLTSRKSEKFVKVIFCGSAGIRHKLNFKDSIILGIAITGNALLGSRYLRRVKDSLRNWFYILIRNKDYAKAKGIMQDVMKKVLKEDLKPELKYIKIESLIIIGSRDKYVPPKDAEVFNEGIKNSHLHIMKGVSHSPHLECPERLAEIITKFFK